MIAYEKKNRKARKRFYLSLGCLILLISGILIFDFARPKTEPVFREYPTLQLPGTEKVEEKVEEKPQFILPYKEGKVVVDYFDGKSSEIISVVEFEGVYRPSQGVDISNNGEPFDVLSGTDGVVLNVTSDPLLGNGILIQSGEYIITYQSLDKITLKKGDPVKQGTVIGVASSNIYQASLKNHLHLVVEKNQQRIDPDSVFKLK